METYSEITTENFNKIIEALQENEKEVCKLYPYLSQNKILSQEEHKPEAIKVMDRIKDQIYHRIHQRLLNGKVNEISQQENIQGLRFVNLVNEIYIYYINKRKRYFMKRINQ